MTTFNYRNTFALANTMLLIACGGGGGDDLALASPQAGAPAAQVAPAAKAAAVAPQEIVAKTYHIRTDGGLATQCNGLSNTPYPGTGTGLDCAWKGPMVALPPGGKARFAGGDTVIIHKGEYMVGYGAPGAESCSSYYPWDCAMPALPSGPDAAHPTRFLGEGYTGGCSIKPQLWGTERAKHVLNMTATSNAEVSCLDITDHNQCVEFHSDPGMACNRSKFPYGQWASHGLIASDSRNIKLSKMDIHGMGNRGVMAGRLTDWTVDRVRIAANGWAGWDGDLTYDGTGKGSSNNGTMRFTKWTVEYNGCGETYPEGEPVGCWGQTAGGYGDGVGTGETNGDWIIEDSVFRYNTSDGLDLLYHRAGTITINRVRARGNASNQLKTTGIASVSNSMIIGNCGYFDGKPFTFNVDNCRAAGDALAMMANAEGDQLSATNNTIVSSGNVAIVTRGPARSVLKLRNNIMVGMPKFNSRGEQSADTFIDNFVRPGLVVDEAFAVKQDLRSMVCSTPNTICGNAGLVEVSEDRVNPHLTSTSVARDSGAALGGALDMYGNPRLAGKATDRGAVEEEVTP